MTSLKEQNEVLYYKVLVPISFTFFLHRETVLVWIVVRY